MEDWTSNERGVLCSEGGQKKIYGFFMVFYDFLWLHQRTSVDKICKWSCLTISEALHVVFVVASTCIFLRLFLLSIATQRPYVDKQTDARQEMAETRPTDVSSTCLSNSNADSTWKSLVSLKKRVLHSEEFPRKCQSSDFQEMGFESSFLRVSFPFFMFLARICCYLVQ